MEKKYDFSGWATKNDLRCTDGRVIRSGAFRECDGTKVPLVWNHGHTDPTNVLGHAVLENRDNGVYCYCTFNNTPKANHVKNALQNGDLDRLSIYANQLVEKAGNVLHGAIKEVSLVLAGANPGAQIDTVLAHSDEIFDGYPYAFDEADRAVIVSDDFIEIYHADDEEEEPVENDTLVHADEEKKEPPKTEEKGDSEETVQDVFNTLTDKQKDVVYFMIGQAIEQNGGSDDKEDNEMKHNVFEEDSKELIHADVDMKALLSDAKRLGSLHEAVLQHAEMMGMDESTFLMHAEHATDTPSRYGIMPKVDGQGNPIPGSLGIDSLFPEYRTVGGATPEWIKRNTDWVDGVMSGVHHTPFSRIKSIFADITEDDARARGYFKGNYKKEEVFSLLKRTTDPQTVYKKQRLDRDDIIDITDFDVVAWIKAEMRMMLDEELARAILVGDGRLSSSDDKIQQSHIRSIYLDDDFYSNKVAVRVSANATEDEKAKKTIRAVIKARKDYKGSGNPTFYTTADVLTDMLLLEDGIGHRLYKTEQELATALRVSKIVEVEVMEGLTRTDSNNVTRPLLGIIVNLSDYNVGADKGGAVATFEDFDIDYNQQKYLIETRLSGALIKPHSAMVIELEQAAS